MGVIEEVKATLTNLDVQVIYGDFHKLAFYHPATNNIYLSSSLEGIDKRNHFLHEAGHAILHLKYKAIYNTTPVSHLKMESEANNYMVNKIVQEYVETYGIDTHVNIYDFMKENKIEDKNEFLVKSAFIKNEFRYPRKIYREVIK